MAKPNVDFIYKMVEPDPYFTSGLCWLSILISPSVCVGTQSLFHLQFVSTFNPYSNVDVSALNPCFNVDMWWSLETI
jgi:hypothetical protein